MDSKVLRMLLRDFGLGGHGLGASSTQRKDFDVQLMELGVEILEVGGSVQLDVMVVPAQCLEVEIGDHFVPD